MSTGRAGWARTTPSTRSRRRAVRSTAGLAVVAVVAALLHALPAESATPASGPHYDIEQISLPPSGAPAFDSAEAVGASADGRYAAFLAAPDGGDAQLYVRDRTTGTTTLVSHAQGDAGAPGPSPVADAAISADGGTLAYETTDGQVIVADRAAGTVRPVPQPDLGSTTVADGDGVSLSADGAKVAFVARGTSGTGDRCRVVIAGPTDGTEVMLGTDGSDYDDPQLSADGATVAFATDDRYGVIVGVFEVASAQEVAEFENLGGYSLAADGNSLALVIPAGADGQVAVHNLRNPQARTVTVAVPSGQQPEDPRLSSGGTAVSFAAGDQIYLAAPAGASAAQLVSADADGNPSDGDDTEIGSVAQGGGGVLFTSDATDLTTTPGDGSLQVYYATSTDTVAPAWPVGATLTAQTGSAFGTIDLAWSAADDDVAVTGYEVTENGLPLTSVDAGTTDLTVTRLQGGRSYSFGVRAVDEAGNRSATELAASAATAPRGATYVIDRVSAPHDAEPYGFHVDGAQISGDGRYVAYTGTEQLLAPSLRVARRRVATARTSAKAEVPTAEPTPASTTCADCPQVYLADRREGTNIVLSHAAGEAHTPGDGDSTLGAISGDGSTVAFASDADNLVDDATGLYVADAASDTISSVPLPDDGTGGHLGEAMALSADGSLLAYRLDTTSGPHLVVHDLDDGTDLLDLGGFGHNDEIDGIALSGDGGWLAYTVYRDDDLATEVHLYDLGTRTDTTIAAHLDTYDPPSITDNGEMVAYDYHDDATDKNVAILYDRRTKTSTTVTDPASEDGGLYRPDLSADGSTLAFTARTGNGDEVFVASPPTGAATLVSQHPDGTPSGARDSEAPVAPAVSANGAVIAFDSDDTALTVDPPQTRADYAGNRAIYAAHLPDTTSPVWPDGAALTVQDGSLTATSVVLTWPPASDDESLAGYTLTQDGTPIASPGPAATSHLVTGLTAGTTYRFRITADDAAGNATPLPEITVTTPAASGGGSAALAVAAGPGGVARLRWDAPSSAPAHFRIERGTGSSGPLTTVADVDGDVTTYDDSGLLAASHYRYRVELVDQSGTASAYTDVAGVDTPAVTVDSVGFSVPQVDGARVARYGSTLTVRLAGEPNREAGAVVTYTAGGAPTTAEVTMTESATAGHYTGTLAVPAGATAITKITATLSDGASGEGHSARAAAAGLATPLPVSGELDVTIEPPAGDASITGAKLTVLSDGSDTGAQVAVDKPGTFRLPLAADDDYTLTLRRAGGHVMASRTGVSVSAGAVGTLDITPVLPASLRVTTDAFLHPDQVDVLGPDGALLATGQNQVSADNLTAGETVTVVTTLLNDASHYVKKQSRTVTLGPDANSLFVDAQPLAAASVTGIVTQSGEPRYAEVTATETVDGRPWTFTTRADGRDSYGNYTGQYLLPVLAGKVTVTASTSNSSAPVSQTITVAGGATGTADLDLPGSRHYSLALSLVTKTPGGGTAALPVTYTVANEYQVRLTGPHGYSAEAWDLNPTVQIWAAPGEVYQLCADGARDGLSKACTSITLGEPTATIPVTLTLTGAGRILGTLIAPQGWEYGGGWTADVLHVLDNGQRSQLPAASGNGSSMSIPVPSAGTYEVVVHGYGGTVSRPVDVVVPDGAIGNAGSIPLSANDPFPVADNSVSVEPGVITPGQAALFRVSYHYSGPPQNHVKTIDLGIPAGSTLVPNSVAVDGVQVATPPVTGGYAAVPVTEDAGTVYYAVQTTPDTAPGSLTAIVRAHYGSGGGRALVASASATVTAVTLALPSQIKGFTATASGHAPPGAPVTVYDAFGQVVGRATGNAGGRWVATVTLADRGEKHEYALHAQSTLGGLTVDSATQYVTHDSHLVLPTSITVHGNHGEARQFDPSTGIAQFPVLVNHWLGLTVCFAQPSRVQGLAVRLGPVSNGAYVRFGGRPDGNGCFGTAMNLAPGQFTGALYLDYSSTPDPYSAADLTLDPGALRESLGARFAGVTGSAPTRNAASGATSTLNNFGPYPVEITTSVTDTTYTPTAQDLADAEQIGAPVFGASIGVATTPDSATVTLRATIPKSWAEAGETEPATALFSPLLRPDATVKKFSIWSGFVTITSKLKFLGPIASVAGGLFNVYSTAEALHTISGLIGKVRASCLSDAAKDADVKDLETTGGKIGAAHAAQLGVTAFGLVGGFATLGVSALLGVALGAAIGLYVGHLTHEWLQQANNRYGNLKMPPCDNPPEPPGTGTDVAEPWWILDPSGYTYEAVTANRLAGVTATVLESDSPDGPFHVWDAGTFGQTNPETTDSQGAYGWYVPFGYWKVAYSKPGYRTAYSPVLQVPPPRFGVDVGLVRLADPSVTLAKATSGPSSAVTIGFDDWMQVASVTRRVTVTDADGDAVTGTVTALGAQTSPDGVSLAQRFRFTPDAAFGAGETLTVSVDPLVRDYADHTLAAAYTDTVTTAAATAPDGPADVRAYAQNDSATIEFARPDYDGGSALTGYRVSVTGGAGRTVGPDATSATLTGLTPDTDYTIQVAALNAVGASHPVAVTVHTFATAVPASDTGGSGGSGGSGGGPGEPRAPAATTVDAGGTAWSSSEHTPSGSVPVVASVTSPNSGTITFAPGGAGPAQPGYTMVGHSFVITAPPASASDPLRLAFRVDDAALPAGSTPSRLTVFRDGVAVPACATAGAATAEPDPCVASSGSAGGVTTVTVLSSHASTWTFGTADTAPARVRVDAAAAARVGGRQRIAVRVWNADGSVAANTVVHLSVTGATTVSGTARTGDHGQVGTFYYTPTAAGTDTITATVGGHSDTTTVRTRRAGQRPVLSAISRRPGTVNVAVQTQPRVTARKVKLYYVVDPGAGRRKRLHYAGYGITDARGRAHLVLRLDPGGRFVLKARLAGQDYVEHLSRRFTVTVRR